jgi:hypothetical protein
MKATRTSPRPSVQRFSDESIGPSWVRPSPRSTFSVSGRVLRVFSFRRRTEGFTPPPLLSSSYLPPRSTTFRQLPPHAHARAPLLRFCPLQRSTETGVRFSRSFQPPAPSVFRVSHPLDVLLHPQPWPACFIRPALLGFHRVRQLAQVFRPGQGVPRPGFLSEAFSLPVTTCSPQVSSLARQQVLRPRSASVISPPVRRAKPPAGCCRVSITEKSVYPEVASQGHQLP